MCHFACVQDAVLRRAETARAIAFRLGWFAAVIPDGSPRGARALGKASGIDLLAFQETTARQGVMDPGSRA
jgi:hypothetical protein